MTTPKSQQWQNRPKAYREKNSGCVVRISHPGLLAEVKAAKAHGDLDGAAQALREHRERQEKSTK